MKKLSEYKDEEAIELLADIIEPATEIIIDKEVVVTFRKNKLKGIKLALKRHKKAVFACLAALNGESVETYHCNLISVPKTILEVINDKELMSFFASQSPETDEASSGSVSTTGEGEGSADSSTTGEHE